MESSFVAKFSTFALVNICALFSHQMPVIPLEIFCCPTKNALTSGILMMMKSVAIKPLLVLVAGLQLWSMEWFSVSGQQPPKFQAIKLGALFTQDDTKDVKQAN